MNIKFEAKLVLNRCAYGYLVLETYHNWFGEIASQSNLPQTNISFCITDTALEKKALHKIFENKTNFLFKNGVSSKKTKKTRPGV